MIAEEYRKSGLEFTGISLEGTNWKELVKDIEEHSYDLVVMGANGMGRVPESLLGSVTERVARRIHTDLLIVKDLMQDKPEGDKIVVCLDGSERSFGGLKAALELGALFGKQVEALSAFDPYFHYGMFQSLNQVLSDKARKVFKFEEQEKLHEEMITVTDAINTVEFDDYYVITPNSDYLSWNKKKFLEESNGRSGTYCEEGFSYDSGKNDHFLTVGEIKELIIKNIPDDSTV